MPGKVKVRIVAGRNLPVMDRASDTCDAFVEIKLSNTTYKTEVFRHSLNPEWNSEWFRFEVDDEELQDEPLQIRVMDYDTYSANDAIGKVYIDLNPLLCKESGSLLSGWFPIYDTMHGIRGEINVMVRVHLFSDSNKYRESSCGVQFFYSSSIPWGFKAKAVLGFVEELVVNDDPEYQWIDKIRTPRASNEARQTLFSKLSGEVQRKIGLKALELGGNAVIGYHQCFDLEGESGIVVRGIGTAVILTENVSSSQNEVLREHSPSRVALRRVSSSTSVASVQGCDPRSTRLYPLLGSAQGRSRSPSPIKIGLSPGPFKIVRSNSSVSPKKMAKARSELFSPVYESECAICKDTSQPKEKAHQSLRCSIPAQLKRFASFKSNHISMSQLKRICSDPLYPRSPVLEEQIVSSAPGPSSPTEKICHSPAKGAISAVHRRSSDSDLSTTPKGGSFGDNGSGLRSIQRPAVAQESLSMLEYPFITMRQFPVGFIQHVGGVVSARSVKLLVQINNPDEPETRDAWWTELRKEIRSHIRALGCNVVLGYMETTNISDDICVLSASGTAAVLSTSDHELTHLNTPPILSSSFQPRPSVITTAVPSEQEKLKEISKDKEKPLRIDVNLANQVKQTHSHECVDDPNKHLGCRICHIPYSESSVPFPINLARCNVCRKGKVPDVLFMTIEPPSNVLVNGKSCLLQARVCKNKKDGKGEQNAKEISDSLPFLEYELHRQLLNKLKVKCMNAIFGLKVQVSIGDKLIIGIATGTGTYLSALPPPSIPKLACGKVADEKKMAEVQKQIQDAMAKNKEYFNIKIPAVDNPSETSLSSGKNEEGNSSGDEDLPDLDLSAGNKDACILEVDDADDVDIIAQLIDPKVPPGFDLCNTETLPGLDNFVCNLQMFTRIYRTKFSNPPNGTQVSKTFEAVIKSLFVKLRRLVPCCLTNLSFQVDLVEQDELQVTVLGIAVGLGESNSSATASTSGCKQKKNSADSELMFHMDEDKTSEVSCSSGRNRRLSLQSSDRSYCYHLSLGEHNGVDITPLSYIPGKKIEQYLGDLDFFFIRESSSIRESGGLNGFIQSFVAETLAIVRAHVSALGGNAMVGFHMTQCILLHNPHKNQGQCLVNVAGDAVFVHVPPAPQPVDADDGKVAHFEVQDSYGP
ncbi:c2 domain-containing protein 5 [Nephila pilipes]|uniref:C2 domain-containing protein 5 n=1 Tax=Nephila pilipes TaxID=299642 RepID=A0A8X6T9R7_NEPPI|nr:c2 domain-containing protein 5 [Nephila pilipes]